MHSDKIKALDEKCSKLEGRIKNEEERLMDEVSRHEEKERLLSQQLENAHNANKELERKLKDLQKSKQENEKLQSEINNMQQKLKDFEKENTSLLETNNKKKYAHHIQYFVFFFHVVFDVSNMMYVTQL